MHSIIHAILGLSVLSTLTAAQAGGSAVFSQFMGTTSVSAPSYGDDVSASISSSYLTICTNYVHNLVVTTNLASSVAQQLFQVQVDGVCQLCTSLSQTRVDSCCAQSTSSACFAHFGQSGGSGATATAPAHTSATATLSPSASGGESSGSASAGATASGNGAGFVPAANNVLLAESVLITFFGFVALAL